MGFVIKTIATENFIQLNYIKTDVFYITMFGFLNFYLNAQPVELNTTIWQVIVANSRLWRNDRSRRKQCTGGNKANACCSHQDNGGR